MKVKVVDSHIKGYHIFYIRPHVDIPMKVLPENGNKYDPSAMAIWMPPLDAIESKLHNVVTRGERPGIPCQRVRDAVGRMVGRVPANLGKIFREIEPYVWGISWYIYRLNY